MTELSYGTHDCRCSQADHDKRLIVLTGGPGAGKTAVLETARRALCRHAAILPEAAGIVFGGGFPRHRDEPAARRAAQRAIFHVQREVERLVVEEGRVGVLLCDRGTVDGAAYWPGSADSFWSEVGKAPATEIARYAAVIHLRTPGGAQGFNHQNVLRVESAEEAARLDDRILEAWSSHPRRFIVDSASDFLVKARRALDLIRGELPPCCQAHIPPFTRALEAR